MTAMIIIITIIIPTLSASLCMCGLLNVRVCVCVCRHVALKILYARLREVFMNLVHLHGV